MLPAICGYVVGISHKEIRMNEVLNLSVEFSGVSVGKETASIGIKMSRDSLSLDRADEIFVGHRLQGTIQRGDGDKTQRMVPGMDPDQVTGTFDATRIGVNSDVITSRLKYSLEDIDITALAPLANKSGRIIIEGVEGIPSDAPSGDDEETVDVPAGSLHTDIEDWREVPLDHVFDGVHLKAMWELGLSKLSQVSALLNRGGNWNKPLKGIGPKAAAEIVGKMAKFWSDNPQFAESAK
jgi:hypothetical protein